MKRAYQISYLELTILFSYLKYVFFFRLAIATACTLRGRTDPLSSSVKKLQEWSENCRRIRVQRNATCRFLERANRDNARQMINFENVSRKQSCNTFRYDIYMKRKYVGHARYAFSFSCRLSIGGHLVLRENLIKSYHTPRDLVILDISSRTILAIVERTARPHRD